MYQLSENLPLTRTYLLLLGKAWKNNKRMFSSKEEEDFFKANVYRFCNSINGSNLSGGDFQSIYSFIENSIVYYLDMISNDLIINHICADLSYIIIFIDFLAHHYNQKVTTQLFFKKLTNTILEYPSRINDKESVELIMELLDKSEVLHTLCHYMATLNLCDVSEDLLSTFMKKARATKQSQLFRFYLYPFNNHFFRCNYPSFPDECDARELYFGVFYGYFNLTYNSAVYKILINMCESVSDDLIIKKSHYNPVYNYYLLSEHNSHLSISDIYNPLKRLFRD